MTKSRITLYQKIDMTDNPIDLEKIKIKILANIMDSLSELNSKKLTWK
jgi:hypothetical protein